VGYDWIMSFDSLGVLQLGDPRLRKRSKPVGDVRDPELLTARDRLHEVLAAFRAEHGFGRAIAAPQIGVLRRFVALNLGEDPRTLFDPEIVSRSDETFTLWDDCMSFPDILVRVRRHVRVSVAFTGEAGERRTWRDLPRATAELLQHEIDHLDGILALDRALDPESVISRATFDRMPRHFAAMVDP